MEFVFPKLSDVELARIVRDIDLSGFAVLANCIPSEAIESLQGFVEGEVARAGGQYVALTGPERVKDTQLARIAVSPEFIHACRYIYEQGTGLPAPTEPFYQVLRCLSGERGKDHSWYFHYDSYALTVLFPIIIPKFGQTGDLLVFPNARRIRKSYLVNLIEKILLDNPLTQKALKLGVQSGLIKPVRVRLNPGNAYFFWGCRSIHTNEPCDPATIRATAPFHFVNAHSGSWLRRALGRSSGPTPY